MSRRVSIADLSCPACGGVGSSVKDCRGRIDASAIRRRRECNRCDHRWTTYELTQTKPRPGAAEALDRFDVALLQVERALGDARASLEPNPQQKEHS